MVRTRSIAAVIVLALAVTPVPALPSDPVTPEAQIKAGIVFNLALTTSWPEGSLPPTSFVIGVIGHDASDPPLSGLAGKELRRRSLVLRDPLSVAAAAEAQIVYISRSRQADIRTVLDSLAGHPLLTVSDVDGFCEAGGMVQLRRDRNRIQLRVNREAAERAGLGFSSQLLKVAEIVEGGD
ncbi:MAG: YfiR family protein [bacterium]|nr:YfiR family protein [bacterium]